MDLQPNRIHSGIVLCNYPCLLHMYREMLREKVEIEWDEGTTDISDGESSDEEDDIDSDDNNEGNNGGADERESEPGDGDEELGLIDNEERSCNTVAIGMPQILIQRQLRVLFVVYWLQDTR